MLIDRRKLPGELIQVPRISITWPLVSAALVIGLTVGFWKGSDRTRATLNFSMLAAGVVGGLLGAYYVWAGLKTNADLRQETLEQERINTAFDFVRRWNDPHLGRLRRRWRKLMRLFDGPNAPDVKTHLNNVDHLEDRTTVADVLNFFEEIGYAVDAGVADEKTLRAIFEGIVFKYYRLLYPWISQEQERSGRPAFAYFERLRNRWIADQSLTDR